MKQCASICLLLATLTHGWSLDIIAHRGASADAPENTVPAAKLAWVQKADAVEIDIHLSADGKIVAIHDDSTKKTAGKNSKVRDQSFEELRKLDAGIWKAPKWKGTRIPSLSEVIATVPPGKQLVIEIKCGPEVITPLATVLSRSTLTPEQTVIIGFNYDTMKQVRQRIPKSQTYWLSGFKNDKKTGVSTPTVDDLIKKATSAKLTGVNVNYKGPIDAAFTRKIQAAGLKLLVWTVNDANVARKLKKAGVDGITTDKPEWLRQQLQTD